MTPVLLPGNMCDARLWPDPVRSALPNAIHADLSRDDRIEGMARRTLEATSGPLLAVGFSMGAIVAAEMARLAPDRLRGLVLLGYNAGADLPERAAHRPAQQAEVLAGGLERVLVEELKPNYLAATNRTNGPLLERIRAMGMDLGPDVFVAQSEALRVREDRRDFLATLRIPVLYGCGAEDRLCPAEWHRQWQALTPSSALTIIAGAGHLLPLERPDALALAIARWALDKDF